MPSCRMRTIGFVLTMFPIISPLSACAQSTPSTNALVAREITVLELAGGGTPLTPTERRQAAEAVASGMRGNPQVMLRNYADLDKPLQRAARDRAYAAGLRRILRYALEEGPPAPQGLEQTFAIERQIVRAHDPTVVFDPARKQIITESNLRDYRTASEWLAREWNLPPPTGDFTAHLREWFRTSFIKTDKDTAEMLATQGESFPFVASGLAKADPKAKEAAILQVRQQLQAADPTTRDLGLATAVAALGARTEQQATQQDPLEGLCTGFPFTPETSRQCRVLYGSVFGLATVRGINNADVFAHDLYHQPPTYHH